MQKSKSRLGDFLTSAFGKIITFIVIFISLYPIIWVFLSSFKENPGGLSLPTEWVFDGYITIFTKLNILTYFKNSFIITIASTVTPHQEKMIKEGVKAIFHKYKEAI